MLLLLVIMVVVVVMTMMMIMMMVLALGMMMMMMMWSVDNDGTECDDGIISDDNYNCAASDDCGSGSGDDVVAGHDY